MTGQVMHHRLQPWGHGFRYRLALFRLDLDELPRLSRTLRLLGVERARPLTYRAADHLSTDDVRARVRTAGVTAPVARMELVTSLRTFGYVFNPVSFFFCYGTDEALLAVVCEVNNTFGQRHVYVLPADEGQSVWHEKKVFHVSPFFTLDGTYRFEFHVGREHLEARIDLYRGGEAQFVSRLSLDRRPLTDASLLRMLVGYPLLTLRVIAAIHWQALRLWWKGAVYHPEPAYAPETARQHTES
jgi:DUF1365 family protein